LRRVLIIDDQPDVRAMISIVLRISHFGVVEAASAQQGLNEFEGSKFDLAIVDIFLQGSNGLDVIRKMRERIPGFPIVAISGMTSFDFLSESPELSNVVCVQKPFRPAELIRAIEAAMAPRSPVTGRRGRRGCGNCSFLMAACPLVRGAERSSSRPTQNAPANRGVECRTRSKLPGLTTPSD